MNTAPLTSFRYGLQQSIDCTYRCGKKKYFAVVMVRLSFQDSTHDGSQRSAASGYITAHTNCVPKTYLPAELAKQLKFCTRPDV
jgi:hypothetical protein